MTKAEADLRVDGRYSNSDGDLGRFVAVEPPARISFTWENPSHCPGTLVDVTFEADGPESTVVVLEHTGFRSPEDVEQMKGGWSWALDSFRSYLETGEPIPHETWLTEQND